MSHKWFKSVSAWLERLPSFAWIILIVLAIAGLIGSVMASCYLISHYEGVATLLMIGTLWIILRLLTNLGGQTVVEKVPSSKWTNVMLGLCIAFYAGMGVAIDQPGNWLFNRPFQWFYCPEGTELAHGVNVSHPLPERTDVTQEFTCVTKSDRTVVKRIGAFPQLWIRFVEYVLVAYILIGLHGLYNRWRSTSKSASA